jgi:hypothetical protein
MKQCCTFDCRQGRDCPRKVAHVYPQPPAKEAPLRLAPDVFSRGTRRSLRAKLKRGLRSLWRYLTGPAPW